MAFSLKNKFLASNPFAGLNGKQMASRPQQGGISSLLPSQQPTARQSVIPTNNFAPQISSPFVAQPTSPKISSPFQSSPKPNPPGVVAPVGSPAASNSINTIPAVANQANNNFQGQGNLQTTGSTTNSVPQPYAPYVSNVLQAGWNAATQPYPIYGAPRIAPLNAQENQALSSIQGLQGQYQPALNQAYGTISGTQAQYSPYMTQAASDIQSLPGQYQPLLSQAQQAANSATTSYTPQQWNSATAGQYMDPYMQSVVQDQQNMALHNAQIAQRQMNGNAAAQGAFGGTRMAMEDAENQRNLGILQNQIANQGLSQAYQQGQNTFNTANQMGLSAAQFGNQAPLGVSNALSNIGSLSGNLGISGANALSGIGGLGQSTGTAQANALGNLATTGQNLGLTGANANLAAGQIGQGQTQNSLNLAYSDFLAQHGWPQQQLSWYNTLLGGSYPNNYNTTTNSAQPNQAANYLGLGIAGLGALSQPLTSGGNSILGDVGTFLGGLFG